jgi:hypothetical protein
MQVLRGGIAEGGSLHVWHGGGFRFGVQVVDLLAVALFHHATAEFETRR